MAWYVLSCYLIPEGWTGDRLYARYILIAAVSSGVLGYSSCILISSPFLLYASLIILSFPSPRRFVWRYRHCNWCTRLIHHKVTDPEIYQSSSLKFMIKIVGGGFVAFNRWLSKDFLMRSLPRIDKEEGW